MQQSPALESSVLVLNKFFMAVHVISAKRAFTLLFKDSAEVIHLDENKFNSYDFNSWREVSQLKSHFATNAKEDWVRAVSFDIRVPRVIRLLFYDRLPQKAVKFNRRNIFARDENMCQYCGKRFSTSELSLEHVVPKSQGGVSTWTNIVCACTECNKRKGGRTPKQAHMRLVREPTKPKRNPLFSIKLSSDKYQSWKQFLDNAYWSVELED